MRCPSCETELPQGARFCLGCGASMLAEPMAPADPLRAALEAAIGFQYRVVRLLGRGGMGAVYLAHELALDREVAIKVLPPDRGEASEGLERFRREARTAARLNHAHVVPLYTFGEVRGIVYYVMGYVKGEPLSARMKRDGRLPADEARRILSEVCDALQYAHGQGVVHRDLKPDNVLIEEGSGRSMLTDFGIAKAMGSGHTLTATGAVVGTPHYMSPEQAAGKGDVDGRSDLYSLGVMGYAMLAGRLPFEGKSAGDILVQHLTKEPPPLAPLATGVPETVVKAITRCLAKDPSARWPDAGALRRALSPVEEDADLPESLRVMRGTAQAFFLGQLVALWFGWNRWIMNRRSMVDELAPAIPILAALFLPLVALAVHREGHPWRSILRAALLQPAWWRTWYPASFRRAGDVWDRLPRAVRLLRVLGAAMLSTGLALAALMDLAFFSRSGGSVKDWVELHVFDVALAWVALFWVTTLQFTLASQRLRRGSTALAMDETWRVLIASTADRRFWSRPTVAAVLEAPREAPVPAPTGIVEILGALDRLAGQVAPAQRECVERARAAANAARVSYAALDEELGALEKDHDAALAKQVEERLAALGEPRAEEPPERRRMRELLSGQVELMRGVASRIDHGKREQARRVEHMKALWQSVEKLRTGAPDRQAEAAARVTSLCDEFERGAAPATATKTGADADVAELKTLDRPL